VIKGSLAGETRDYISAIMGRLRLSASAQPRIRLASAENRVGAQTLERRAAVPGQNLAQQRPCYKEAQEATKELQ